ncbi:HTH-type transcriptional regulator CynR (plasmid) [Sphingobium sp. AntQ-1]|uniref:LysR family transcriptional regulator n=1 Tax=Sphingobium sp. AntQ-1 TaxID=2930091 RepID=UPI00234EF49B|nr:LysR family transcriptional regulator [Sphingobium sp. AntQ-1]WCP15944.1 HTH-type transcriptional regulator CynR [Sphingobium sp. AntQ-1]
MKTRSGFIAIARPTPVDRSLQGATELAAVDVRQLHYFLTLVEQGSISSAAAVLQIAQPSLSESLMRLERKLDAQLVFRGGRTIILTEAGQLLAKHGREIVNMTRRAIDEIRYVDEIARGPVAIGLPPTLGHLLTVPLAETIQSEYPDIRLHITEGMSGNITEWVENDRLDFGYAYETGNDRILLSQPVFVEKLFFVAAPDNMPPCINFDETRRPIIEGKDLNNLPLALPAMFHSARRVVERLARGAGVKLNVIVEIDSLPQIITMVTRASAYSVLPHAAVMEEIAAGTLKVVEIIKPAMTRTAYSVHKRSRPITRASQVVQQAISIILREIIERHKLDAAVIEEA